MQIEITFNGTDWEQKCSQQDCETILRWKDEIFNRPPCPSCGHRPTLSQLTKEREILVSSIREQMQRKIDERQD